MLSSARWKMLRIRRKLPVIAAFCCMGDVGIAPYEYTFLPFSTFSSGSSGAAFLQVNDS